MKTILITGGNRGLGHHLVQMAIALNYKTLVGVRPGSHFEHPSSLQHPNVDVFNLDVRVPSQVEQAYKIVSNVVDHLDILVNNAGVHSQSQDIEAGWESLELGDIHPDGMFAMYQVNAIGPLLMTQAFLPLLKCSENPRILNISSRKGSISDKSTGGNYGYACSKAALNMGTRILAEDLKSTGIIAVAINPGWVQTGMGGDDARLSPEESVRGILELAEGLSLEDSGKFIQWDGSVFPY